MFARKTFSTTARAAILVPLATAIGLRLLPYRPRLLRLVAHLFASRDEDGGEPPAAVTALWRPYRRMRLS